MITTEIYNSINHRDTPTISTPRRCSFAILALMFLLVVWQWRLLRGALPHRDRQGLFAERHQARAVALGDVFVLHAVFPHYRRAAGRTYPARARKPSKPCPSAFRPSSRRINS